MDISERMVELARNKLADKKLKFINADAQNLNLNEKFDLITSNACFLLVGRVGSFFTNV